MSGSCCLWFQTVDDAQLASPEVQTHIFGDMHLGFNVSNFEVPTQGQPISPGDGLMFILWTPSWMPHGAPRSAPPPLWLLETQVPWSLT